MTMHVYLLTKSSQKIVEPLHLVWTGSKVTVDGSWYDARAECVEHAISKGHKSIAIMVGTVELYLGVRGPIAGENGKPVPGSQTTGARKMTDLNQKGLWLFLSRLTRRYGHTYVPPLGWQGHRAGMELAPTVPLVAAYQTAALAQLGAKALRGPLGGALCDKGYDSFTLGDYFHYNLSDNQIDENGTAASWKLRYDRAIADHL